MRVYCMISGWQFLNNPPWNPQDIPVWPGSIPRPLVPSNQIQPWDIQQLQEFKDLLRRVKELEDKLGCPCEPKEADYIQLLQKRIDRLEQIAKDRPAT